MQDDRQGLCLGMALLLVRGPYQCYPVCEPFAHIFTFFQAYHLAAMNLPFAARNSTRKGE